MRKSKIFITKIFSLKGTPLPHFQTYKSRRTPKEKPLFHELMTPITVSKKLLWENTDYLNIFVLVLHVCFFFIFNVSNAVNVEAGNSLQPNKHV